MKPSNTLAPSLLVGLGNPGSEYEKTRHNAGFAALDAFADALGVNFSASSRFLGLVASSSAFDQKLHLLKPTTFMNRSGASVASIARYYKIPLTNIFVFYDDMDVQKGTLKLKSGGGAAGHNGIKDITQAMGSDFFRVRLGVGRPKHHQSIEHVLGRFSKDEAIEMADLYAHIAQKLPLLLSDFAAAQKYFHTQGQKG